MNIVAAFLAGVISGISGVDEDGIYLWQETKDWVIYIDEGEENALSTCFILYSFEHFEFFRLQTYPESNLVQVYMFFEGWQNIAVDQNYPFYFELFDSLGWSGNAIGYRFANGEDALVFTLENEYAYEFLTDFTKANNARVEAEGFDTIDFWLPDTPTATNSLIDCQAEFSPGVAAQGMDFFRSQPL